MATSGCPLCNGTQLCAVKHKLPLWHCLQCFLVFKDITLLPNPTAEKARYHQHQNSENNEGYVQFLNKAITPALPYLKPHLKMLDFGCGPHPVLAEQLQRQGFNCEAFDPFFFSKALTGPYDVIWSTEVLEHLHHPAKEIARLYQLMSQNGLLVLMTELYENLQQFEKWWYVNDQTHVVFYHIKTFDFIAKHWGFALRHSDQKRVLILQKN